MTARIIAAWLSNGNWHHFLFDDGEDGLRRDRAPANYLAAESGQRIIWPDGHGVATVEDIPEPPRLPDQWINHYDSAGPRLTFRTREQADLHVGRDRIALEHTWTDDDGERRAEVFP